MTGVQILTHVAHDKFEYFQFCFDVTVDLVTFLRNLIIRFVDSHRKFLLVSLKRYHGLMKCFKKVQTRPRHQKITCPIHWSAETELQILNSKR